MYLNFFRLSKEPFHITPDPEFFFLSPTHREALATIMYGVGHRKGFMMLTGEVGTGKTTILCTYLESIDRKCLKPIYIFNANVSFPELLKAMYRELGLAGETDDPCGMVTGLHRFLIDQYRQGRTVVLIIDEAQNMPVQTLENLRMLSNLETSRDKLLQVVLSGQPEFNRLLERYELRQLKQRIAVRATVAPLTGKESAAYIRHRLSLAGLKDDAIFTRVALNRIVRQAKGIPRTINILCDNALLTAYGYRHQRVRSRTAGEIIGDLEGRKGGPPASWWICAAAAMLLLVGVFWVCASRQQARPGETRAGSHVSRIIKKLALPIRL